MVLSSRMEIELRRVSVQVQVVDKVKMQMDSFLEDGSHEATVAVIRALSVAIPLTTSTLRDYILRQSTLYLPEILYIADLPSFVV